TANWRKQYGRSMPSSKTHFPIIKHRGVRQPHQTLRSPASSDAGRDASEDATSSPKNDNSPAAPAGLLPQKEETRKPLRLSQRNHRFPDLRIGRHRLRHHPPASRGRQRHHYRRLAVRVRNE